MDRDLGGLPRQAAAGQKIPKPAQDHDEDATCWLVYVCITVRVHRVPDYDADGEFMMLQVLQRFFGNSKTTGGAAAAVAGAAGG